MWIVQPRKTVLLVDDSKEQSFLVERAFSRSKAGIVFPVHSGELALEHLRLCGDERPVPDLVLLDRDMPGGMDGFETLREIRRLAHLPELPVVMISGSDYEEHQERARDAGADGYLVKQPDRTGFDRFTQFVLEWNPGQSWRSSKEIVRSSCAPGAVPVLSVDSVSVVMMTPRSADQKLIELTAACEFAGITVQRALALRVTDQILDDKRRRVVRYLMAAGWSNLEVQDFMAFERRYLQERRSEKHLWPQLSCAPRALALK